MYADMDRSHSLQDVNSKSGLYQKHHYHTLDTFVSPSHMVTSALFNFFVLFLSLKYFRDYSEFV